MGKLQKVLNLLTALSTSQEGTSPYIIEKADALNKGDLQNLRSIQDKEGDLARKATILQTLALGPIAGSIGVIPTSTTLNIPTVSNSTPAYALANGSGVITSGAAALNKSGILEALGVTGIPIMLATKWHSNRPSDYQYEPEAPSDPDWSNSLSEPTRDNLRTNKQKINQIEHNKVNAPNNLKKASTFQEKTQKFYDLANNQTDKNRWLNDRANWYLGDDKNGTRIRYTWDMLSEEQKRKVIEWFIRDNPKIF